MPHSTSHNGNHAGFKLLKGRWVKEEKHAEGWFLFIMQDNVLLTECIEQQFLVVWTCTLCSLGFKFALHIQILLKILMDLMYSSSSVVSYERKESKSEPRCLASNTLKRVNPYLVLKIII